jgi:hypothetical protein
MNLSARISRLEGQRDLGRPFLVQGRSEAEHEERIAELIAANVATPNSLFVCIMKRGERL